MCKIFHFTHQKNLDSILREGKLLCDSQMISVGHEIVGNRDIKRRRLHKKIPVKPFGTVGDYVPFYFAPRSPMLFSIYKNNVPNCTHEQGDVVYLYASVKQTGVSCDYCFSDRNAALETAIFYSDINLIENVIDWPLMRERYWANTPDDLERRDRRMAEFLVFKSFPWDLIEGVAVYSQKNLDYVQDKLSRHGKATKVHESRDWYF